MAYLVLDFHASCKKFTKQLQESIAKLSKTLQLFY